MVILSPFPSSFIYLYHLYFICSISIVYLNQHLRVDSKETISFAQRNAFLWTHDIKHLESKAWNFHTFKPTDIVMQFQRTKLKKPYLGHTQVLKS